MKLLYKPFGLIISVVAGLLASQVFSQVWKLAARRDDVPDAKNQSSGWGEVAVAAVVQGAVQNGVKTLVKRAGQTSYAKATGTWPGPTD